MHEFDGQSFGLYCEFFVQVYVSPAKRLNHYLLQCRDYRSEKNIYVIHVLLLVLLFTV